VILSKFVQGHVAVGQTAAPLLFSLGDSISLVLV